MAKLSEAEKEELLELAHSAQLRRDCQILKRNQENLSQNMSLDEYIQFLNDMNALMNHTPKPFKKITGTCFIL
jgi:hypothetical protein